MKTLLSILGGVFIAIIVAAGGLAGFGYHKIMQYNAESKAYVEVTLPRVLATPTLENFVSFMAPQDSSRIDAKGAADFFTLVSLHLGKFQSCDAPTGNSNAQFTPAGANVTAQYATRCRFANNPAVATTIAVRKLDDKWTVINVHIDFNRQDSVAKPSRPA